MPRGLPGGGMGGFGIDRYIIFRRIIQWHLLNESLYSEVPWGQLEECFDFQGSFIIRTRWHFRFHGRNVNLLEITIKTQKFKLLDAKFYLASTVLIWNAITLQKSSKTPVLKLTQTESFYWLELNINQTVLDLR